MNTDRLLDVLTSQLSVLKASISGQDVSEIFDDEGFDVGVVLNTPNALMEEMVESNDIAQIYLSGLLDGLRKIGASATPRHRRQALSLLFEHRAELVQHMAAVERVEQMLRAQQRAGNVVSFQEKA